MAELLECACLFWRFGSLIRLLKPFPLGQKHRQGVPGVLVRAHGAMRHFQAAEELLVGFHKSVETRQIFLTRSRWANHTPSAGLKVLEHFSVAEREFDFVAVQHLE